MAVRRLAEMTWEEVRDLDRPRAVAILPIGATEAHGPHLPLATDVVISEAMAEEGAKRLAADGRDVLLLPTLAFTPAAFAAGFPGTVSLRKETAAAVLEDIARELARHRLRTLAIANSHFDPSNIESIYLAKARCDDEDILNFVYPDLTRKPWALRLTDEFKTGACHAGCFEGSIVLARRPDLVREDIRRTLEPNPASLSAAIRAGKRSFEDAGGPRAYFGSPREATGAEGESTIAVLGRILDEAVRAAL